MESLTSDSVPFVATVLTLDIGLHHSICPQKGVGAEIHCAVYFLTDGSVPVFFNERGIEHTSISTNERRVG